MMADFVHLFGEDRERASAASLQKIDNILRAQNQSLEVYGLPVPRADLLEGYEEDISDEYAFIDQMVTAAINCGD